MKSPAWICWNGVRFDRLAGKGPDYTRLSARYMLDFECDFAMQEKSRGGFASTVHRHSRY
jgi:hypothetical protein